MEVRTIEFRNGDIMGEGDLYMPAGFDTDTPCPALVIGHGFATLRTSLAEEGRLFAEAGFVTLAIDYSHLGGSGGAPRGRVWPMRVAEDFRAAIDWLELQPGVDADRIGIWGTSFAGGIVTHVAAHDIRVQACVAQAPILDGDAWLRSLNREYEYELVRRHLLDARRARARQGGDPIYSMAGASPDGFLVMPADPFMIDDVTNWFQKTGAMLIDSAPEVTLESFERVMEFDATYAARKIAPRAYCVVQVTGHDVYHPNPSIQEAYKAAGEPKRMVSLKMDQFDPYKPGRRETAIGAAIDFYREYLT